MAEIGLPDPEYSEPNNFMVKLVLRNNIRQFVPYLNDTEGMTIRKVIAELGYLSEGALVKWVREDPRDAGCTPTSVYQWMHRYHSEGILGLMNARNAPMPAEPMPGSGGDGVEGAAPAGGGPAVGECGDEGDDQCFIPRQVISPPILKRMTVKSTAELRPWSYRQNALVKSLITIAAGVASAFVGTFAHRMGAELSIPYGLVLAFLLIGLSTWCARSRMGAVGLAMHLIASSLTAWGMALTTTSGKALIVAGFQGDMPFFSQHAGYIWLYGLILVQVVLLILPARWFVIPTHSESRA